ASDSHRMPRRSARCCAPWRSKPPSRHSPSRRRSPAIEPLALAASLGRAKTATTATATKTTRLKRLVRTETIVVVPLPEPPIVSSHGGEQSTAQEHTLKVQPCQVEVLHVIQPNSRSDEIADEELAL